MSSREVSAILKYLENSGVPFTVTATVGHYVSPTNPCSPHVAGSYHCKPGTDGIGLAVDVAGPFASWDSPQLRAIFDAFAKVGGSLAELIYAGAPYNIKNGVRVPPYAVSAHHNHVHVSVEKGTFLVSSVPTTDETFDAEALVARLPVLKRGSSGNHVKILQGLMIVHAGDLFDEAGIDGDFGPKTEAGIKTWQARTGQLTPDGVVGPATWKWLIGF